MVTSEKSCNFATSKDKRDDNLRVTTKIIIKVMTTVETITKQVETFKRMINAENLAGCIILVRGIDEYIAYEKDAVTVSEEAGIDTITVDVNGMDYTAVAFACKDLDWLLPKLVRRGKRVAVCEGSL